MLKISILTAIGIFCMIFCVVDWVFLSLFLQKVETSDYDKPYFIRYCVNSSYSLVFIPWYIMKRVYDHKYVQPHSYRNFKNKPSLNTNKNSLSLSLINDLKNNPNLTTNPASKLLQIISESDKQNAFDIKPQLTDTELFKTLLFPMMGISFLGLISGYTYYWCLKYVDTAIANTVYQSECAYVYIFSVCYIKNMKFNTQKIIAIIISLIGVALISFYGNDNSSNDGTIKNMTRSERFLGIGLLLFSTLTFSILETLINYIGNKWFRKDRQIQDTLLLQGIMGLETLLIWWIMFFIWDYTKLEPFEIPSEKKQIISIVFTAVVDLFYNLAYFMGITLLNAFLMAMSSLLVIPISFIALVIIYSDKPTVLGILGAILIFVGFVLLELPFKKISPCCRREKSDISCCISNVEQ